MRRAAAAHAILLTLILSGCTTVPETSAPTPLGPPPAELGLAPFYRKHISVGGLPVVGSEKAPDAALRKAAETIRHMLAERPDVLAELARSKVRVAVMAQSEKTTDIPEHSDLKPKPYWDQRARGLGATRWRPAVSCAEENLLRYPDDPYRGEDILVHEFAHTIHLMALNHIDETFDARLEQMYHNAIDAGLWHRTYAATNHREYWAEGVQAWFDCNLEADPPDGIHNHVNTREELREYDPALAKLIAETLGDIEWRFSPPTMALRAEPRAKPKPRSGN